MLLNEPAEKVLELFPSVGMETREFYAALDRCKLVWNAFIFGTLVVPGFYVLTVPSLNISAGAHAILVHVKRSGGYRIYDPNKGKKGKKFYGHGAKGHPLRSWFETVFILPGGQLPKP